jgi:S-adenosylmethionine:tRNA ribosyltransferase-isomerase
VKLSDFDYYIPNDQIAQYPLPERDSSKLVVLDRREQAIEHRSFKDIVEYLNPGNLLVLNNTKVFPARIIGKKPSGTKVEILLVSELKEDLWEILLKGVKKGIISFDAGVSAEISRLGDRTLANFSVEPNSSTNKEGIKEYLFSTGAAPLPFYIKRAAETSDSERYQTVYADREGAIAAPTAGLHFTDSILTSLKNKGVEIRFVTLHVGYGTFKPVVSATVEEHIMDEEIYEIGKDTAEAINNARSEGRRIVAVGTTVTRTLESAALCGRGTIESGRGKASMFIYPGYKFRIINALITNFHQPRSTPMMLTSAFSGLDLLKQAYSESQKAGYRFFSYGDSMMII